MATVYFTASSLDGYIVDEADSLDWLTSRAVDADGPFGYEAFIKTVGALVMGSATYEWILNNHPGRQVAQGLTALGHTVDTHEFP
jgi:dihydrofolate reductase